MQATISWFIGILEGEGNFDSLTKRVRIKNTDFDIIENCEYILKQNYILFKRYQEKKTKSNKNVYNLYISNQDCRNLYNLIEFKLDCRRKEFQQIIGASETTRDISLDLDWLIGIWEVEGTFCISKNYLGSLVPSISLCNTNNLIIEKLKKNFQYLECPYYCKNFVPTKKKPYTILLISGFKRCQRFLIQTKNLWLSKRNQLRTNLMLEYLESRLSKTHTAPYTEQEKIIYEKIRLLNS